MEWTKKIYNNQFNLSWVKGAAAVTQGEQSVGLPCEKEQEEAAGRRKAAGWKLQAIREENMKSHRFPHSTTLPAPSCNPRTTVAQRHAYTHNIFTTNHIWIKQHNRGKQVKTSGRWLYINISWKEELMFGGVAPGRSFEM